MVDWTTVFGSPVSVFLSTFLILSNVTLFTLFGHDVIVNTFAVHNQPRFFHAPSSLTFVFTMLLLEVWLLSLATFGLHSCICYRFMRSFPISIMNAAVNIMKSGLCNWRWHIHPTTECIHTSITLAIIKKSNNCSSVFFISFFPRRWLCPTALPWSTKLYAPCTLNTR